MGNRSALLIGISEYGDGFDALPGSLLDIQELKQILQDPDCGAYDLQYLSNEDNGVLNTEIEGFFQNRDVDDLLLFYFSGHGDLGGGFTNQQLHLCAGNSKKENGVLVESTAVSAAFLKRQMDRCRAKNIILILDCCYSGAIADLLKKGEDEIDFHELKAKGRVVLASSSASQSALQEPEGLSLYTKYLIEGMRTIIPVEGKWISARQLHNFADRQFEVERQGGSRPKIFSDDTGFDLPIVKAPKPDAKLEYRKELDRIYQELDEELHFEFDGEINDPIERECLEISRECLGVNQEDAITIEKKVQEPYLIRAKKRQRYADLIRLAQQTKTPLRPRQIRRLNESLLNLGLGESDQKRIEEQLGFSRTDTTHQLHTKKTASSNRPKEAKVEAPSIDTRYQNLVKNLSAEAWKNADRETYRLMITKVGKKEGDSFSVDDLKNYPCDDLKIIDQFWVQYSQGHFGFSIQKDIWEECVSPLGEVEGWVKFCDRVGWRVQGKWLDYDSLTPSLSSPRGNFPFFESWGRERVRDDSSSLSELEFEFRYWELGVVTVTVVDSFSSLASRLVDCSR